MVRSVCSQRLNNADKRFPHCAISGTLCLCNVIEDLDLVNYLGRNSAGIRYTPSLCVCMHTSISELERLIMSGIHALIMTPDLRFT